MLVRLAQLNRRLVPLLLLLRLVFRRQVTALILALLALVLGHVLALLLLSWCLVALSTLLLTGRFLVTLVTRQPFLPRSPVFPCLLVSQRGLVLLRLPGLLVGVGRGVLREDIAEVHTFVKPRIEAQLKEVICWIFVGMISSNCASGNLAQVASKPNTNELIM